MSVTLLPLGMVYICVLYLLHFITQALLYFDFYFIFLSLCVSYSPRFFFFCFMSSAKTITILILYLASHRVNEVDEHGIYLKYDTNLFSVRKEICTISVVHFTDVTLIDVIFLFFFHCF